MEHIPVLKQTVVKLAFPCVNSGDYLLDTTLGGAGHALFLLKEFARRKTAVKLIGTDRDSASLALARKRLAKFPNATVMKTDFANLKTLANQLSLPPLAFILADLGISSLQLDDMERGFSFRSRAPIDMRMDNQQTGLNAQLIIKTWNREKIARALKELVQERFADQIASAIAKNRRAIKTAKDLAQIISEAVPTFYRNRKIHPATKTFLALRIMVNDELNQLNLLLSIAPALLKQKGRLVIITFHSHEDKLVKQAFYKLARSGDFTLSKRKPLYPSEEEKRVNPRSRSAKLRYIEKSSASCQINNS